MRKNSSDLFDVELGSVGSVGSDFITLRDPKVSLSRLNSLVNEGKTVRLFSKLLGCWILVVHSNLKKQHLNEDSRYSILELQLLMEAGVRNKNDLLCIEKVKKIFSCQITSVEDLPKRS